MIVSARHAAGPGPHPSSFTLSTLWIRWNSLLLVSTSSLLSKKDDRMLSETSYICLPSS